VFKSRPAKLDVNIHYFRILRFSRPVKCATNSKNS
jgi:hypothetical protein